MSIVPMALTFEAGGLTASQKSVLLALADHAHDDGSSVFPSVAHLVVKTALSERTVRKVLGELRDVKLLIVVRPATHVHPTEYRIDLDLLESMRHPQARKRKNREGVQESQVRGARDAPLGVQESQVRGARDAPKSSINPKEKPKEEPKPSGARARTKGARTSSKDKNGKTGVAAYPEDVWPTLEFLCNWFGWIPPNEGDSEFTLWIRDLREIDQATGGYPVEVLQNLKEFPEEWMFDKEIGRPGSLIRTARGRFGRLISEAKKSQNG